MKSDMPPAAFRLLNSGLQVHTHFHRGAEPRPEGAAGHLHPAKIQRMRELEGTMSRRCIAEVLKVSRVTVRKYLGWAKQKPGRK
jgi:DNA-binding CsgD family transcriptional regulator